MSIAGTARLDLITHVRYASGVPRRIDHDAMRETLLDGAGAVFSARGYAATGMRELAAALGVSTGTLYHYFPDKKALFDQLVARTVAADVASLEAVLGAAPPAPLARLDAFFALVRREEAQLQLQSAVLVEYARLLATGAEPAHPEPRPAGSPDAAPPRPDRPTDAAWAARAPLRDAHARYASALARLLGVSEDRALLVLHAVSGVLLQRFTDAGATPFDPIERELRALLSTHLSLERP
jgi:AcrR family transcriptional regulator